MQHIIITHINDITLNVLRALHQGDKISFHFKESVWIKVKKASDWIQKICAGDQAVYGINTGFGQLAQKSIPKDHLKKLQENLILSHAAGVGENLSKTQCQMILFLKIMSLSQGHSGVRPELLKILCHIYKEDFIPVIPSKGSVGASGDLAPLSHMSATLLGHGHFYHGDQIIDAKQGLELLDIEPFVFGPKEGLALINGTQASTGIALGYLFEIENLFKHSILASALITDAIKGSYNPLDPSLHKVKKHDTQLDIAHTIKELLDGSEIHSSHKNCDKVQDPYSIRCQPQVLGACLHNIRMHAETIFHEAVSVSDNPIILPKEEKIISGGHFHAEFVAQAADGLAIALAEMGNFAERQIALLIDSNMSGLPSFLVDNPGVNSGFMIAHVTSSALASENKTYAHPASVDTIPTSCGQEDHVSMATFAARRLGNMCDNVRHILAIDILTAFNGIHRRKPLQTGDVLRPVLNKIQEAIEPYTTDRYIKPDIIKMAELIKNQELIKDNDTFKNLFLNVVSFMDTDI